MQQEIREVTIVHTGILQVMLSVASGVYKISWKKFSLFLSVTETKQRRPMLHHYHNQYSVFLQARWSSCHPTNTIKALKGNNYL